MGDLRIPIPPNNPPPANQPLPGARGGEPQAGQPAAPGGDKQADKANQTGGNNQQINQPDAENAAEARTQQAVLAKADGLKQQAIDRAQQLLRNAPQATTAFGRTPGPLPPQSQGQGYAYGRAGRDADNRGDEAAQPPNPSLPETARVTRDRVQDRVGDLQRRAQDIGDRAGNNERRTARGTEAGNRTERRDRDDGRGRTNDSDRYADRGSGRLNRHVDRGSGDLNRRAGRDGDNRVGNNNASDVNRAREQNLNPNRPPNQNYSPEQTATTAQGSVAYTTGRARTQSERNPFRTGEPDDLPSAAIVYLRGASDGTKLPRDVRQMLSAVIETVGQSRINHLVAHDDRRFADLVERVIGQMIAAADNRGGRVRPETSRYLAASMINELIALAGLDRYFTQASKTADGSRVITEVRDAVMNYLSGVIGRGDGGGSGKYNAGASQLWRDVRGGLFNPAFEQHNPFPLTGRARVVSEMMEMMRTLDAIDRFMQNFEARLKARQANADAARNISLFAGVLSAEEFVPNLPGTAGREEAIRFISQFGDTLFNANGRGWHAPDGAPLRVGEPIWISIAGGLLGASAQGVDALIAPPLSASLLYGFDAIYPVIGFDGRTLNPPQFLVVQAQVNDAEPEWIFGQEPLSLGWALALIERLKDSFSPDHNSLGEMLEEALVDGRFYTAVVGGTVMEGTAETFALARPPLASWPTASAPTAFA